MITSFFKPRPGSRGKRPRGRGSDGRGPDDEDTAAGAGVGGKRRAVVSPSSTTTASLSSSPSPSPSDAIPNETATLLSFLSPHGSPSATAGGARTWREALGRHFAASDFASLARFVEKERALKTVYPPPELTFSALNLTPLHKVKVVIVGQDPYHQPGQGHGLAFSVPHGVKVPPSLRNIYKELQQDVDVQEFGSIPRHGNLERWARQGVLLLNNVLTVRRGEAASHAKRGWERFTDGVIGAVAERDVLHHPRGGKRDEEGDGVGAGVVFLLWGKPASLKAQTVLAKCRNDERAKHAVIMCSHPSPLGATKTKSPFMGSRCFSRANKELVKRGWGPIDWRVDGPLDGDSESQQGASLEEEVGAEGAGDLDV